MACRTSRDQRDLLRVVRRPDGTVALDTVGRAPGRGAYTCRSTECVEAAITKGALGRALEIRLTDDLRTELRSALLLHIEGGARGQE